MIPPKPHTLVRASALYRHMMLTKRGARHVLQLRAPSSIATHSSSSSNSNNIGNTGNENHHQRRHLTTEQKEKWDEEWRLEHLRGRLMDQVPKREWILAKVCGCLGALWILYFKYHHGSHDNPWEDPANDDDSMYDDDADFPLDQPMMNERLEAALEFYMHAVKDVPEAQDKKIRFFKYM